LTKGVALVVRTRSRAPKVPATFVPERCQPLLSVALDAAHAPCSRVRREMRSLMISRFLPLSTAVGLFVLTACAPAPIPGPQAPDTSAKSIKVDYAEGCIDNRASACVGQATQLEKGDGVPKDEARAVSLYEKACKAGIAAGCIRLGLMVEEGRGVEVDVVRAGEAYKAACDRKDQSGCMHLAVLKAQVLEATAENTAERQEAAKLYQVGCDRGELAKACVG
jgi:Sel1 repeat